VVPLRARKGRTAATSASGRDAADAACLEARARGSAVAHGGGALAVIPEAVAAGIEVRRFAGPADYVGRLRVRVAHVTDIHVGRVTPMRVQHAAVAAVNALEPDLVVVTGDFVCHSQLYLDALEEIMASYRAPVVGVLGNHDYWSGADAVRRALLRAGVEMLANAHTTITLRGERLQLVGLDDAYTGHADRWAAVRGLRADLPSLGLSHIAEEADGLWRAGVPLVLAGHTHGGQVTFARLHELAIGKLAGHRYVHGLYGTRRAASAPEGAVYVGAGIGAAVMPLRLGERGRREVTVFELGAPVGEFAEHHAEQTALRGRKPSPAQVERRRLAVFAKELKREAAARRRIGGSRE
jgi:predicted MPP superfamily phosphohydrolase